MMFRLGCNVLILNTDEHCWEDLTRVPLEKPVINIWWQNNATGRLMLMFAYLMTRNDQWEDAKIRLLAKESRENGQETKAELKRMLEEFRINAEPETVPDFDAQTVAEKSKGAAVMFYPFRIRQHRLTDLNGLSPERILKNVPIAVLTMAAEDIDLSAEPEEGAAGDLAQAVDTLTAARKKEKVAQKEFEEAEKKLAALKEGRSKMENHNPSPEDQDKVSKLDQDISKAESEVEKAQKRAGKAAGNAALAFEDAVKLGYNEKEKTEAGSHNSE
jgi:hypothetical protein